MRTVSATELKNLTGLQLEAVAREPILISRLRRPYAVLLSYGEFQRLQAFEDRYWGEMAKKAVADGGYLTPEESNALLAEMLNAHD